MTYYVTKPNKYLQLHSLVYIVHFRFDGVMLSGLFSYLVAAHKLFNPCKLMMLL